MNDFARIEAVIRHLDENHVLQPSLNELASVAGLSESHFHRLFHRWAGVTPKNFLQCLTLEHAKQRLRESASVMEAALDAGLSGPGRLHDLLVTIEAASPGEFKNGGKGMRIEWGIAASPFGPSILGWNDRGICHLTFAQIAPNDQEPQSLRMNWPHAQLHRDDRAAVRFAKNIFRRDHPGAAPIKAFVCATPFQLKVWQALLQVPEGCVATYGSIASRVGAPGASRAVGTACGANAIAYLIPCHRVIRETGALGGYRWGEARKRALLAWEHGKVAGNKSARDGVN